MRPHLGIHFRITRPEYVSSDLLVQFISSTNKFQHYVLVQEDPDEKVRQTHNHFAGCTTWNTEKTVRDNLKKSLPCLYGNADYGALFSAITDIAKQNMFGYVCKGKGPNFDTEGPQIVNTDMTPEEIRSYHKWYWEDYAKEKAKKVTQISLETIEEPEKKRKRTKMFMEKLRDEIVEEFPDKLWNFDDDADFNWLTKKLYRSMGAVVKNLDQIIWNRNLNGLYSGLPKSTEHELDDLATFRARYRSSR